MTDTNTPETTHYTADVVAITPGRHADPGETSRDTAARELAEETGVHVAPGNLRQIGTFDHPDRDPRGRYVTVAYLAHVPAEPSAMELADRYGISPGNARNWLTDFRAARAAQLAAH